MMEGFIERGTGMALDAFILKRNRKRKIMDTFIL